VPVQTLLLILDFSLGNKKVCWSQVRWVGWLRKHSCVRVGQKVTSSLNTHLYVWLLWHFTMTNYRSGCLIDNRHFLLPCGLHLCFLCKFKPTVDEWTEAICSSTYRLQNLHLVQTMKLSLNWLYHQKHCCNSSGTYCEGSTRTHTHTTIHLLEGRSARHDEGIQKYTKTRLERTVNKIWPRREVEYTAVHLKSFIKHEGIQHTELYITKQGRTEPWQK
jgi:hypothetical protein